MQPEPVPGPTSRPANRRAKRAALVSLCLTAWPAAFAHASPEVSQVDVRDRTSDETLPVYRRFGERWIVGERGHEYALRIRNVSSGRVLAVVSVDGVNAVTGETAATSQSGYVIEPGGSVSVEGWRKSLERTAAFVFTTPSRAYAARTDRPDNIGVIGVAFFREREREPIAVAEAAREASDAPAATTDRREAQKSAAASPSLGTGHGRGEYSPAQWTAFERASDTPDQVVALRYESRATLVAMGVLPRARLPRATPDPFPAAPGFVPDP